MLESPLRPLHEVYTVCLTAIFAIIAVNHHSWTIVRELRQNADVPDPAEDAVYACLELIDGLHRGLVSSFVLVSLALCGKIGRIVNSNEANASKYNKL